MLSAQSLCLVVLAILSAAVPASGGEPFRYPEGKHGRAELRYINDTPVLTVVGTPAEIGEQIGVLTARPAGKLLNYPQDLLNRFGMGKAWGGLVNIGQSMLPNFPPDHLQEMEALAKAAGVDRKLVIAGNTMFDIKKMFACSSILVEPSRSATGDVLFGRNLDFPTLGYLQDYSLVTVYRPAGKRAFASVGFPGLIGCLSGMNDAGLALAVHEVYAGADGAAHFDAQGTPYALGFRRILEECATVEEAERLLRSLKRTTNGNLAIADAHGRVAVLEISVASVVARRDPKGMTACTNHFLSDPLALANQPNVFHTLDRYADIQRIATSERLSLADIAKALDAANQGAHTLQTMVFEPRRLTMHLACGSCPTTKLPLKKLDLTTLLKGQDAAGPTK